MLDILAKKIQRFLPLNVTQITPKNLIDIGGNVTLPPGFHGTNPSFVCVGDEFLVCIRCVNYHFDKGDLTKIVFTCGDSYRTLNRFFLMDRAFRLIRTLPALDTLFDDVEDIKLFLLDGQIMGSGSNKDPSSGSGGSQIALLSIDPFLDAGRFRRIASPFGQRHEKNWAPFVSNGQLHFIYSFEPLVILRCDTATASVSFADSQAGQVPATALRFLIGGSSTGLPVPGGTLFVAHRRRVSMPSLQRTYVSRIYHLDSGLRRLTAGRYFTIGAASVQFINGFYQHGDNFVISFGEMDNRAFLCSVLKNAIAPAGVPPDT